MANSFELLLKLRTEAHGILKALDESNLDHLEIRKDWLRKVLVKVDAHIVEACSWAKHSLPPQPKLQESSPTKQKLGWKSFLKFLITDKIS